MNGIYIPGLNMPNSCVECLINYYFCHMDYKYFLAHQELYDQRSPNCPLVPVPPHGRLIEESKVLDIVSAWCPDDDGSVSKVGDLREILDEIEALPTIIEAEEGE